MGKNQHVVSHGERWAVKAEGAPEPVALFKTQSEAWEKAKSIARKERSEALLHGKNGRNPRPQHLWPRSQPQQGMTACPRAEEAQGLKISAT